MTWSNGSPCKGCLATYKCLDTLNTCSGWHITEEFAPKLAAPEAGKCNAKDTSMAGQLQTDIPNCLQQTQSVSGIAACIEKDGFSAPCAQCVGTFGSCIISDCLSDCESAPNSAACKNCVASKCQPAFMSCTGFPSSGLEFVAMLTAPAAGHGNCNAKDTSMRGQLQTDISMCLQETQ